MTPPTPRPIALVASTDEEERRLVASVLSARFEVVSCEDGQRLLAALGPSAGAASPAHVAIPDARHVDLVVTPEWLPFPGATDLDAMAAIRQRDPFLPVIVITDTDDERAATAAAARGALAAVERPIDQEALASWAAVARACFAPAPIARVGRGTPRPEPAGAPLAPGDLAALVKAQAAPDARERAVDPDSGGRPAP